MTIYPIWGRLVFDEDGTGKIMGESTYYEDIGSGYFSPFPRMQWGEYAKTTWLGEDFNKKFKVTDDYIINQEFRLNHNTTIANSGIGKNDWKHMRGGNPSLSTITYTWDVSVDNSDIVTGYPSTYSYYQYALPELSLMSSLFYNRSINDYDAYGPWIKQNKMSSTHQDLTDNKETINLELHNDYVNRKCWILVDSDKKIRGYGDNLYDSFRYDLTSSDNKYASDAFVNPLYSTQEEKTDMSPIPWIKKLPWMLKFKPPVNIFNDNYKWIWIDNILRFSVPMISHELWNEQDFYNERIPIGYFTSYEYINNINSVHTTSISSNYSNITVDNILSSSNMLTSKDSFSIPSLEELDTLDQLLLNQDAISQINTTKCKC